MNGPSTHLSWKELACKDGTPYPEIWRDTRGKNLGILFEKIRSLYCKPITVLSAYRTAEHNKKVGGARNSQHLYGRALDLKPPKGVNLFHFYENIRANTKHFGITGLGKYKTFIHVDIRPSNRLAVWSGSGVKDSRT